MCYDNAEDIQQSEWWAECDCVRSRMFRDGRAYCWSIKAFQHGRHQLQCWGIKPCQSSHVSTLLSYHSIYASEWVSNIIRS